MKLFKLITPVVLTLLLAVGCSKVQDDDLFEESPAVRLEKARNNYTKLLESSTEGWVFQYFALPTSKAGGFNYYLKFKDGYVTAKKGSNSDKTIYTVLNRGGNVLSFNTHNKVLFEEADKRAENPMIHDGADVDFQFLILSATENEFILKGVRTGNKMRLVKLKSSDYESKADDVGNYIEKRGIGEFIVNDKNINQTTSRKVLNYTVDEKEKGKLPYVYTDTGILFYEPYTVDGVTFKKLTLDKEKNILKSENGKVVLKLNYPLDYDFYKKQWALFYDLASQKVKDAIDKIEADFNKTSLAIDNGWVFYKGYVSIGLDPQSAEDDYGLPTDETTSGIMYYFNGGKFSIQKFTSFTGTTNPNELNIKEVSGSSQWYDYGDFQGARNFTNFILSHSPYTIEGGEQKSLKLISKKDPEVWFVVAR
ncbi:MAG: DUF4302 domain-containing protein [Tenacibaculum sp.]|nr:DUF4302 domain-containing protein [Tenacibaculum sp.]